MLVTIASEAPQKWLDLLWDRIVDYSKDGEHTHAWLTIHNDKEAQELIRRYRLPFTPVATFIPYKGQHAEERAYIHIKEGKLVKTTTSKHPLIPHREEYPESYKEHSSSQDRRKKAAPNKERRRQVAATAPGRNKATQRHGKVEGEWETFQ